MTLNRLKKMTMVLEPLVDKVKGKLKMKEVHVISNQWDDLLSEERELELVYARTAGRLCREGFGTRN